MALKQQQKQKLWKLFAKGATQREIAAEIGIGTGTVNRYRKIYDEEVEEPIREEVAKSIRVSQAVEQIQGEMDDFAADSKEAVSIIKHCLEGIRGASTKTEMELTSLKIKAAKDAIAALTDRNKHIREITGADKTTGVEEDQKQLIATLDDLVKQDQERRTTHLTAVKKHG